VPTLDELRRWARGEPVDGLLPHVHKEVDKPKPPSAGAGERRGGRYKVNAEGTDAVLLFGLNKGETLSTLVQTARGRTYLSWILKKDFDDALKAACTYQLELFQRDR
jgi:hypothetical protein